MDVNTYGPFRMTKAFMPLIADSLALQLEPTGVKVSFVEPGKFSSQIAITAEKITGSVDPRFANRFRFKEPDEVAEATIRKSIEVLVQLNEGHAYTYDRDALVRMLEEALKTSRPATPMPAPAAAGAD